jgi:MFS family permease
MAIYMAIFMGGTPLGAPIVGWVANEFGPRWSLGVGAAAGVLATLVGLYWLIRYRGMRLSYSDRHFSLRLTPAVAAEDIEADRVAAEKS